MKSDELQRRKFLGGLAALTATGSLRGADSSGMIYRQLGTTGEKSRPSAWAGITSESRWAMTKASASSGRPWTAA